jgi:peptidoglycan hydrolase-like protein with peptidoglycan-binding domain
VSKRIGVIVAAVAVAGLGTTAWLVLRDDSSKEAAADASPITTATVSQRDLVIYDETAATLGFTTSVAVSSPVAGTVTSLLTAGEVIDPGTVIATIDSEPVVALIGDVPAYRDLSRSSSDGIDVRQLELNLVLLGFDPENEITIDETYDRATANAVTLFEDSLGLDGDGKLAESEVAFLPGHLLVDSVSVAVGGSVASGGQLLIGRETERSKLVAATGSDGGAVTTIVAAGTPVVTGTVLFWKNGFPVVAIEGDPTAVPALTRDLSTSSSNGADVRLLETMLIDGGFDPDGAMTLDDDFDDATAAAVLRWWASLGLTTDSAVVPAGSFVVVPGGMSAGASYVADGSTSAGDPIVLSLTTAAREVTTSAPIDDPTFALGATIEVEFPDGTVSNGTVVDVGTVAVDNSNIPGSTPTVTITLTVVDIPTSVDAFVQIPVTLRVVSESEDNAFVVPVSALIALAGGGFALEVVTGKDANGEPSTKLIRVTPGLFADGFVSVTGDSVEDGLEIVGAS